MMDRRLTLNKGEWKQLKIRAFEREGKSFAEITSYNVEHAKKVISDFEEFSPTLFVVTDDTVYYILLDVQEAEKMQCSPMDQVKPILFSFVKNEKEFGKIDFYHILGEAWMKKFSTTGKTVNIDTDKIRYGDIAKMASRVEVLMEIMSKRGENTKIRHYEMVRQIDGEQVMAYKKVEYNGMDGDVAEQAVESTKFPSLIDCQQELEDLR